MQNSGSPGDHDWQPLFLPLGLAMVGLLHPDSTFPRGWCTLVVEVPDLGPSDSVFNWGGGDKAPRPWEEGVRERGSIDKTIHQL